MKKLANFRDLGGLPTACGRSVKKGRLLRCEAPSGLIADDIQMLKDHGLARIIDLRSEVEVKGHPVDQIEGVKLINIDVIYDKAKNWTSINEWIDTLVDADTSKAHMLRNYEEFIIMESSQKGFAEFMRHILDAASGATLFHCAAGKDRTGFAAAILLKTLGVPDEDIYEDYLKTIKQRADVVAQNIEKHRKAGLSEQKLAGFAIMAGVERAYLELSFKVLEEKYGNFDNYISQCLGLTAEDVAQLKTNYLE